MMMMSFQTFTMKGPKTNYVSLTQLYGCDPLMMPLPNINQPPCVVPFLKGDRTLRLLALA
jgi:hypothetical protein